MRSSALPLLALALALPFRGAAAGEPRPAAPAAPAVASYREAVEADWFLQDKVRTLSRAHARPQRSTVSTRADARGGVDGLKDGKWGFHTENEDNPWWHVDLGSKLPLDRVVLFNRCDNCGDRNNRILLSLSDDSRSWAKAYQHNGTPFAGQPDGKPLAIKLDGKAARFVRLHLQGKSYFHLDEVEVYAAADPKKNVALGKPADQSSTSEWSSEHDVVAAPPAPAEPQSYPMDVILRRGKLLADDLLAAGAPVGPLAKELDSIADRAKALSKDAPADERRALYLAARWTVRKLAMSNALLDFDQLLFVKRIPGSYSHMSDQHYGWWSRPGGGLFVLSGLKGLTTAEPQLRCLTTGMPPGSLCGPDLSYDARRVLFAYCRYYPESGRNPNKTLSAKIPDDAFYHIFEMNADGTGLRQITKGRYDDFDPRYLPDGRIAFISTRRGQFIQCGRASAQATVADPCLPNGYVRCGGDNSRPVPVFTLHSMGPDGSDLRAISAFENFEWTPSVADDGRILYARWDYVDRHNNAFMSLWAAHPSGAFHNLVYGNFTRSPHCIFEARSIPGSRKLLFTASAHHAITAGSICLLDTARGTEEAPPLTRLTPEVSFPEMEGWPATYYNNPWPLSERYYLVAWSPEPIHPEGGRNNANCLGVYLADAFGNLELIHRDPAIGSCHPIPLRARLRPPILPDLTAPDDAREGRIILLDVYRGLVGIPRGTVRRLRIVGSPIKIQPHMNTPSIGATAEDPGKFVLGTVPVEADGSAYFRVPAGVAILFQALDANGVAIQTMRTLTSVSPGQTLSCVGCHEQRQETPPNGPPALALRREPSRLSPGPEGSWPFRFDKLVQPVLDASCVKCHSPKADPQVLRAAIGGSDLPSVPPKGIDLTPAAAFKTLTTYGNLYGQVRSFYSRGYSVPGQTATTTSVLLAHLRKGHRGVQLDPAAYERLITWLDCYAQLQGHFSPDQEQRLLDLRSRSADLLSRK